MKEIELSTQKSFSQSGEICPCGCAPCETVCCSLDCLEKPRFSCGQLLTDQDLTQLVSWTQKKLRLKRLVEGWGVVCGLEVRCDPSQNNHIIVKPGYAVDCCGNDIIVCEEVSYDVSAQCPELNDPCANPLMESEEVKAKYAAVDLYLGYSEKDTKPRAAFGRGACQDSKKCEPSRIKESFELRSCRTELAADPLRKAAEAWLCRYRKKMTSIFNHFKIFENPNDVNEMRRRFLSWLEKNPLHSFCFLRERICEMKVEDRKKIFIWLIQDVRMAFFQCDCNPCINDPGVPLARISLMSAECQSARECRILSIDAYPPYRRPVGRDCWPAPLGMINLGQLVWHRDEDACARLRSMGVQDISQKDFELPVNMEDMKSIVNTEAGYSTGNGCSAEDSALFAGCGQQVTLLTVDPSELSGGSPAVFPPGRRVVGFEVSGERLISSVERSTTLSTPSSPEIVNTRKASKTTNKK